MSPRFDVLGLGCVAVDEVVSVAGFPAEDTKAQILSRQRYAGGTTANAVCAAAAAGARTAFASTIGSDDLSQFALDDFARRGVDTRWIRRHDRARPIQTILITTPSGSRTVFYDLTGARGAETDWPPEEVIASTRYLLIDQFGMEGSLRALRLARALGIEVVADFERTDRPEFGDLLPLVDHLFMPLAVAQIYATQEDPLAAAAKLANVVRRVVVLTEGENGLWIAGSSFGDAAHLPTAPMDPVDTIGCGDVLRGVYAARLARGEDPAIAIQVAMRAAALKAGRTGGRDSYPLREEIER